MKLISAESLIHNLEERQKIFDQHGYFDGFMFIRDIIREIEEQPELNLPRTIHDAEENAVVKFIADYSDAIIESYNRYEEDS